MKLMGNIRKVDELGRIVLPREMRRILGIKPGDSINITAEDDKIVLGKYEPTCIFCSSSQDVQPFRDQYICKKCLEELKNK